MLLLLAGCSQGNDRAPSPDPNDLIECAVGGATEFTRSCVVERTQRVGATILTVRHPNGGFRRFISYYDDIGGPGVAEGLDTYDGAQRAIVTVGNNQTVVVVGSDRYRFPWALKQRVER